MASSGCQPLTRRPVLVRCPVVVTWTFWPAQQDDGGAQHSKAGLDMAKSCGGRVSCPLLSTREYAPEIHSAGAHPCSTAPGHGKAAWDIPSAQQAFSAASTEVQGIRGWPAPTGNQATAATSGPAGTCAAGKLSTAVVTHSSDRLCAEAYAQHARALGGIHSPAQPRPWGYPLPAVPAALQAPRSGSAAAAAAARRRGCACELPWAPRARY